MYVNVPRKYSVISFLICCFDFNFDVLHAATGNRFADANDIRLVNLGPLSLLGS